MVEKQAKKIALVMNRCWALLSVMSAEERERHLGRIVRAVFSGDPLVGMDDEPREAVPLPPLRLDGTTDQISRVLKRETS